MIKQLFCKHNWELISKETTTSNFENISKLGVSEFTYFPSDLKRYLIQVFVCKKCGKIKKFEDQL